jgi:ATP-dependent RNA helicase DDX10/DBP4
VLFATDIASRGLDFPEVSWVVQADCPEDPASYIHRVGRTARIMRKGHALLLLTPSEAPAMVPRLSEKKVPVSQITIQASRAVAVTPKVASEVAADPQLKYLAERAFTSYLRSVWLQPDKEVFSVSGLDLEAFATSLGLAQVPKVKKVSVVAGDG